MNRVKIICSCSKILFLHERLSQNDPEIRFLNSGALICDSEENKNKTFRVKSQKSEKTSRNIKFTVRLFCLLMVNKQTNMKVQHQNLSGPVWSPAAVLSGSTRCRCCCTSPGCPDARVWRGRAHVRERERERERETGPESPHSVCPGPGPQAGPGLRCLDDLFALLDEAARKSAGHRATHTCFLALWKHKPDRRFGASDRFWCFPPSDERWAAVRAAGWDETMAFTQRLALLLLGFSSVLTVSLTADRRKVTFTLKITFYSSEPGVKTRHTVRKVLLWKFTGT